MKRSLFIVAIPALIFAGSCKYEKKKIPEQIIDEVIKLPSMHVSGNDFSVDVPDGWTTKDTTMNGISIFFLIAPVVDQGMVATINILHKGMQNISEEQYTKRTIATMKQVVPDFKLGSSGNIKAGNLEGTWFSCTMPIRNRTSEIIYYNFPKDNVAYVITASAPEGMLKKYRPTFDAVARSFRLKP